MAPNDSVTSEAALWYLDDSSQNIGPVKSTRQAKHIPAASRLGVRPAGKDFWIPPAFTDAGARKTRMAESFSVGSPSCFKAHYDQLSAAQSLLFDFEIDDVTSCPSANNDVEIDSAGQHQAMSEVQALLQSKDGFEERLSADVERFKKQIYKEDGKYDNVVLASMLASMGYRVQIREAVGGGTDFLHNLRHTFLLVAETEEMSDSSSMTLVEPHLTDHFEISSPPAAYKQLLDSIPPVFVGSKERMRTIVSLLCQQMALAFSTGGRMLPPWRQRRSMLSKWLPDNVKDLEVVPRIHSAPAMVSFVNCLDAQAPVNDTQWVPFQY